MKKNESNTSRNNNIDWRQSTKSKKRHFKININAGVYNTLIEEVIDSIENDTLKVFDPCDKDAFSYPQDENGNLLPLARPVLPISIREWLCVGCQTIELGKSKDPKVLAYYESNLHGTILTDDSLAEPLGPALFKGGIVLCEPARLQDYNPTQKYNPTQINRFKFIVAHELVHVFDAMRLIVPACMNWEQFWTVALHEGHRCDLLWSMFEDNNLFLDNYGEETEMQTVAEFWPSKAEEWFRAVHPE